jgi:DNA-binding NtrC family response regulator
VPARSTGSYGVETILLVEDEDALRVVTERILTHAGYSVLGAATGHDALTLAAAQPGQIDLLLTDIRMPGMSGEQLAMALNALRPGLRVLYMSGFAVTMTAPATQVERGDLLEKPFTAAALLERVAAAQPVA